MTIVTEPLDRVGNKISIGDFIVYAGQSGDSACLNFGKVVDMPTVEKEKYKEHGYRKDDGTWVPPVIEIVTAHKLKVQPWNVEENGPNTEWYGKNKGKPVRMVTLSFLDRTAVIKN